MSLAEISRPQSEPGLRPGPPAVAPEREWLETDGTGGFASGTARGIRTRRYHALLLVATTPPTGRVVLVNGFDAWVETSAGRFAISAQHYLPDVVHPDGDRRITGFSSEPWPSWTFALEDGTELVQDILVEGSSAHTWARWRLTHRVSATRLTLRLFLSGRDYHALQGENPVADTSAESSAGRVRWAPYRDRPVVEAAHNAAYAHEPLWFRNFLYEEERRRGLDFAEDLLSPGVLTWDLDRGDARLELRVGRGDELNPAPDFPAEARRRAAFRSPLERAAASYVVRRGSGRTIIAGYPWFTDWGRDTFIAMRGLCLSTGRLDVAAQVLLAWAGAVSEGMLPNRFADGGDAPEYNAADASLWFVVVVGEFFEAARAARLPGLGEIEDPLWRAVQAIVAGYRAGTRYGIRMDEDGLIAAGVPGQQLTWMDAKIGDHVVTPRIGKPVEIQALWINALGVAARADPSLVELAGRALASFRAKFWREDAGCLHDVVDADHVAGRVDSTFRANQILAVGGLPMPLLEGEPARRLVEAVEARLVTRMGLRTLAPGEPGYRPHFEGGPLQRDEAYHQGTVWPWLMGPFVEAWLRVHGSTPQARAAARERFLAPLLAEAGESGHLCEVADAEEPHRPGGCPFQAWSLGELLRALALVEARA